MNCIPSSVHLFHICYNWRTNEFKFMLLVATFFILLFYRVLFKLSVSEVDYLTERNNLSMGYGQALCYYENYLKLVLYSTKDFLSRIRIFQSRQDIQLPHKLYILIPFSCKVEDHIDDKHDCISRCKELEPLDKDIAGIPGRRYNITVYHIRHRNRSVRCALEYAQPLKALLNMKQNGLFTENELYNQRDQFCRSLRKMLSDNGDCDKLIELVEYDDQIPGYELQDVILDQKSILECSNSF